MQEKLTSRQIGDIGEKIATQYLKRNNYEIIDKNFWCKQGEIDIIAKDRATKEIAFIEVKTRRQTKYGEPIDAVNKVKIKHISDTAKYYLYKKRIENTSIRFDVIEIFLQNEMYKLHHLKNAFITK